MAVTFFGNVRTGRKEGCWYPSSWVRVPLNGWGKGEGDGAAERERADSVMDLMTDPGFMKKAA